MTICRFPTWTSKSWYFFILDVLLNAFIITPLTITLWVSTWEFIFNLVEVASHEEHVTTGFWIVLACGSTITFATYLIQHPIRPCVSPENASPAFLAIFLRAEMYLVFIARMSVWVSFWYIIGDGKLSTGLSLTIGLIGLCCLRSLNCGVSMPMNLQLDCQQKPCNQTTRFMIKPQDNDGTLKQKLLYIGDALVTALVIEYLIICLWRGAFNIFDLYLLPANSELSAWVTVIIGYNMFWILVILQFPASKISKQLSSSSSSSSKWRQILWEQAFWLYAFIMMVCLWRGVWNVITVYSGLKTVREPYNFVLSLVMHIVTMLITLGLNVFINARIPSYMAADGALPDGTGVLVKNYLKNVSNMMAAYVSEDEGERTTLLDASKEVKKIPDNLDTTTTTPENTQDSKVTEVAEKKEPQ
ncbi:uncharacterized protein [Amphiura filiformis]|uniref:uncharacterized protein n=1 Tax=Amphiura filiformis TaxID=82378 RepID=UPI003B2281C9